MGQDILHWTRIRSEVGKGQKFNPEYLGPSFQIIFHREVIVYK